MLKLVKPSLEYADAFLAGLEEYKTDTAKFGLDNMRQTIKTVEENGVSAWIEKAHNADIGKDLPDGWVSNTKYWLLDNDEYAGSFTLRHGLTEGLKLWGGHVGYIIAPSKRGRGYAFAGLQLLLTEAAKRGLEQVLITCNTENAASFAVITKALKLYGGEQLSDSTFDGKNYHRVWINTRKQ